MKLISLLLLACVAAAHGRRLQAPTPTQQLNQQRQQQQAAAAQAAAARAPVRRLQPPCFAPAQWYPYQTCQSTNDAAVCGRGYLAYSNYASCCSPQRAGVGGAHAGGCTVFNTTVSCWIAGTYHPTQTCQLSDKFEDCTRNWGRWATEAKCCEPGNAFELGCTKPEPCWVADGWYPARTCGLTNDTNVCLRGWGAFASESECCMEGGGHSEGCGDVQGATSATPAN